MTKYLEKKFAVAVGTSEAYRDNWDAIFAKKDPAWNEPDGDDWADVESCDQCGGTQHGKVSFEMGRQSAEAELEAAQAENARLRALAVSLYETREFLPDWARLRVEEMVGEVPRP